MDADLIFLFIGGEHQVLHLAPVAAALSRLRRDLRIACVCADDGTAAALRAVAAAMTADAMRVVRISPPLAGRLAAGLSGVRSAVKGPLLAKVRWLARGARAIIVPERTSAALRGFGWRRPLLHFRHGAGDRAPRSERRLRAFDHIFVAGDKDVARAVEQGVPPARLTAIGYIKMDYLRVSPPPAPLFDDGRPVVLYNPHFDRTTASLDIAAEVIERFGEQDRYNLVFAPHVRAFENVGAAERAAWMALAVPGRIVVDLGSPHLFDMRYTRVADIYLGDMSSQLYEFLATPRPVAFLNAHDANWRDDPRYAGWRLGEVADDVEGVIPAIDRAVAGHAGAARAQADAVAFAFGDYEGGIRRAADALSLTFP